MIILLFLLISLSTAYPWTWVIETMNANFSIGHNTRITCDTAPACYNITRKLLSDNCSAFVSFKVPETRFLFLDLRHRTYMIAFGMDNNRNIIRKAIQQGAYVKFGLEEFDNFYSVYSNT